MYPAAGITARDAFNEETWNFNYGQPYTEETEAEILNSLDSNFIQGFTLLGGEPFEPENQVELVKHFKESKRNISKERYLVLQWVSFLTGI